MIEPSYYRTMLTRTVVGARVCISLLDNMLKLYEVEESSVGAQAFDIGYGSYLFPVIL